MGISRLVKMEQQEQDNILYYLYDYHINDSIDICDPYYTPPVERPYTDNIDWDAKLEEYNNYYSEEIKQDTLRYQLYLDMLAVKKEMEENPLKFDKEEEYYETDPHKLVNFDETFTPFFDKESNDVFFRNLKNPLRLKWEEIPEEDRKQKIVPIDQAIRKIQYDEIERYFNKYLINKDIAILFLKFMPNIWPISTFLRQFENYVVGMTGKQMYSFFIERVILLGSSYNAHEEVQPITDREKEVVTYMKEVQRIKKKLFKELLACIKVKPVRLLFKAQETDEEIFRKSDNLMTPDIWSDNDILTRFIQKYQLYTPHKNPDVVRVYNYPEISKLIVLLNLSFFNIFPISTSEYEDIRQLNRVLYIHFLWYLKDFFWDGHQSTLQVKNDIKSYFDNDDDYLYYSNLIEYYPSRMVQAKEYFYSYHNKILREVAVDYLEDYFEKKDALEKIEYRHNADFYLLNQEYQTFEKLKQKIYAKSRKLERTEEETKALIEKATKHHMRRQVLLSKILFKEARKQELGETVKNDKVLDKILEQRDSIDFYTDKSKTIVTRSYKELIAETKSIFINTLKTLGAYNEICAEHMQDEPKKYNNPDMDIYKKLLKKKLIEPNLWNRFDDYCLMAFDKYPDGPTYLYQLNKFQHDFIEEFLRDIMFYWGKGSYVPPELNPILTSKRKIKKLK
jgi:hypothetical protein